MCSQLDFAHLAEDADAEMEQRLRCEDERERNEAEEVG